jgi:hypothetical protein
MALEVQEIRQDLLRIIILKNRLLTERARCQFAAGSRRLSRSRFRRGPSRSGAGTNGRR